MFLILSEITTPVTRDRDTNAMACARAAVALAHCEKWLRKSATCWKRLAEAHYARMKSYYTAVSTSAAVLVGMLTL